MAADARRHLPRRSRSPDRPGTPPRWARAAAAAALGAGLAGAGTGAALLVVPGPALPAAVGDVPAAAGPPPGGPPQSSSAARDARPRPAPPPRPPTAEDTVARAAAGAGSAVGAAPAGDAAQAFAAAPALVRVAGAAVPVEAVGTDGAGGLALPDDGDRAAWWSGGAAPGDDRGTAVIAGHVDTAAGVLGAFAGLASLQPADRVAVVDAAGARHDYVVRALRTSRGEELPPDLFERTGSHRLALVTCSGRWDPQERTYAHNLVVWASPA